MRVLGVDPGLTRCGLGVVDGGAGRQVTAVAWAWCAPRPTPRWSAACSPWPPRSREWIALHRPDVVAIERVFSQHNVRTVMGTAQASGVVALMAARAGLPVAFHTPSEVKAAVTGDGPRRQGAGHRHGDAAAGARRGAPARPTPPTRWPWPSATAGGRR